MDSGSDDPCDSCPFWPKQLTLGCLMPLTGRGDSAGFSRMFAAALAVEAANKATRAIPDGTRATAVFQLVCYDSQVTPSVAARATHLLSSGEWIDPNSTVRNAHFALDPAMVTLPPHRCPTPACLRPESAGIVGAAVSSVSVAAQQMAAVFSVAQVSYSSTARRLSDKREFPTFSRVVPSDSVQARVAAALIRDLGWRRIGIVFTTNTFGTELAVDFSGWMGEMNLEIVAAVAVPARAGQLRGEFLDDLNEQLDSLKKNSDASIIFLAAHAADAQHILLRAYDIGLAGPDSHMVWIGVDAWATRALFTASKGNRISVEQAERLKLAAHGALGMRPRFRSDPNRMGEFRALWMQHQESYEKQMNVSRHFLDYDDLDFYAPFAYDATTTLIHAIQRQLRGTGVVERPKLFREIVTAAPEEGLTGSISFDNVTGDRDSTFDVFNFHGAALGWVQVAEYRADEGRIALLEDQAQIVWPEDAERTTWLPPDSRSAFDVVNQVALGARVRETLWALIVATGALLLVSALLVVYFRDAKPIVNTGILTQMSLLLGLLLLTVAAYLQSLVPTSTLGCMSRSALNNIGLTLCLAAVAERTWFLGRVFFVFDSLWFTLKGALLACGSLSSSSSRGDESGGGGARVRPMRVLARSVWSRGMVIAACVSVDAALVSTVWALAPYSPRRDFQPDVADTEECLPSEADEATSRAFFAGATAWKLVLYFVCCMSLLKTWHIEFRDLYVETKRLFAALSLSGVFGVLYVGAVTALNLSPQDRTLVAEFLTVIGVLGVTMLLFAPKLVWLCSHRAQIEISLWKHKAASTASGSTAMSGGGGGGYSPSSSQSRADTAASSAASRHREATKRESGVGAVGAPSAAASAASAALLGARSGMDSLDMTLLEDGDASTGLRVFVDSDKRRRDILDLISTRMDRVDADLKTKRQHLQKETTNALGMIHQLYGLHQRVSAGYVPFASEFADLRIDPERHNLLEPSTMRGRKARNAAAAGSTPRGSAVLSGPVTAIGGKASPRLGAGSGKASSSSSSRTERSPRKKKFGSPIRPVLRSTGASAAGGHGDSLGVPLLEADDADDADGFDLRAV